MRFQHLGLRIYPQLDDLLLIRQPLRQRSRVQPPYFACGTPMRRLTVPVTMYSPQSLPEQR